jgi:hypothetical protein
MHDQKKPNLTSLQQARSHIPPASRGKETLENLMGR